MTILLLWLPLQEEKGDPNYDVAVARNAEPGALRTDPARVSANHLFHAMFGILPLESARTLSAWRLEVGLWEDLSTGSLDVADDQFYLHYAATLAETNLEARLGLPAGFEVKLGIDLSDLLEDEGKIVFERNPGTHLVEPSGRGLGLGDLRLAVKKELGLGFGLIAGVKIPVATDSDDLLTSGGIDGAASILFTQEIGPVAIHLNLGGIVPSQAHVFGADVATRSAFTFGASVVWKFEDWGAILVQIQGNQSVFREVILDGFVASLHVGGRFRMGGYFLEPTVGIGLTDRSSRLVAAVGFIVPLGR